MVWRGYSSPWLTSRWLSSEEVGDRGRRTPCLLAGLERFGRPRRLNEPIIMGVRMMPPGGRIGGVTADMKDILCGLKLRWKKRRNTRKQKKITHNRARSASTLTRGIATRHLRNPDDIVLGGEDLGGGDLGGGADLGDSLGHRIGNARQRFLSSGASDGGTQLGLNTRIRQRERKRHTESSSDWVEATLAQSESIAIK